MDGSNFKPGPGAIGASNVGTRRRPVEGREPPRSKVSTRGSRVQTRGKPVGQFADDRPGGEPKRPEPADTRRWDPYRLTERWRPHRLGSFAGNRSSPAAIGELAGRTALPIGASSSCVAAIASTAGRGFCHRYLESFTADAGAVGKFRRAAACRAPVAVNERFVFDVAAIVFHASAPCLRLPPVAGRRGPRERCGPVRCGAGAAAARLSRRLQPKEARRRLHRPMAQLRRGPVDRWTAPRLATRPAGKGGRQASRKGVGKVPC